MGRQSHISRLALGRSPFEPPLQDENGELVLGPNAQHDTARNYVQQFDGRGHPQNLASQALRRRLIRAQNDALSVVGVVVRRAKMDRSRWQTLNDEQKYRLLLAENVVGAYYGVLERSLQFLSTQWILNFRRRLLTYKSYLGLSLPRMLLSEWNIVGPRSFLFAGVPFSVLAGVMHGLREAMVRGDPSTQSIRPWGRLSRSDVSRMIWNQSLNLLLFVLEYPFHAFSVLQSLYLLPDNVVPPLLAWVPFTAHSPIQLPANPPDGSVSSLLSYAGSIITHPFVLAYVSDRISHYVFRRVHAVLRHFAIKPDRPDRISLQSVRDSRTLSSEIAFGRSVTTSRTEPRGSMRQILRNTFKPLIPACLWILGRVLNSQRAPLAVELSAEIEEELLARSHYHYRNLLRQTRESDIDLRQQPRTLRVMALRAAFNDFNLDPDQSMVDIFELADEMSFSAASRVSTPTPEPEDLPPAVVIMEGSGHETHGQNEDGDEIPSDLVGLESPQIAANGQDDNARLNGAQNQDDDVQQPLVSPETAREPFQPSVMLDALLEPVSSDTEEETRWRPSTPVPGFSVPESPAPSSPAPIITRAASLPNTIPRPVRRPTDIDQDLDAAREELLNPQRPPSSLRDGDVYRVSILSNHAAEAFTNIAASLAESVIMLPIQALFVRSLARNFLTHHPANQNPANQGTAGLLRDVWPLSLGFRGGDLSLSDRFRFWGSVYITDGVQGLVHFVIWVASTRISLSLGKRFGWGNV